MRDNEIKRSKIMKTIRGTNQLRLINIDPNYTPKEGEDQNELELIPLQLKPLVKMHAEILVTGKMRNRKYKVITVPELDKVHKDFFEVVKNLHDSTRQLKRVDAIVFPLLELKSPYISQPDIKHNPKMVYVLKLIDKLIEQCLTGCRKKIVNFQSYTSIFDKKVDGIILELKKQSFALANEGSEMSAEEDDPLRDDIIVEENIRQTAPSKMESAMQQSSMELQADNAESYDDEASDDDDDDDAGGFQGNAMAYKSVEIDQTLLRNEIDSIRKHRFSVLEEVANHYDFGMLYIDCQPFKTAVVDHCVDLEQEICSYL